MDLTVVPPYSQLVKPALPVGVTVLGCDGTKWRGEIALRIGSRGCWGRFLAAQAILGAVGRRAVCSGRGGQVDQGVEGGGGV